MIRRLQPKLAKVEGISSYLQPVQDLTVEDRVSRTQFQYTLEDADAKELAYWAPRMVAKLQDSAANCATWPPTSRMSGLLTTLMIDRDTRFAAGHLAAGDRRHAVRRVWPAASLDDVHAVEPIPRGSGSKPEFQQNPDALKNIYVHSVDGPQKSR